MNDVFRLNERDTEYVFMIAMDSKCNPTGFFEISHGTVNLSLISPREIIIKALLSNAVNVVLIHNHPSGCSIPSTDDFNITKRLKEAFLLVGLNFCDHIIIAENEYCSFAEEKLL